MHNWCSYFSFYVRIHLTVSLFLSSAWHTTSALVVNLAAFSAQLPPNRYPRDQWMSPPGTNTAKAATNCQSGKRGAEPWMTLNTLNPFAEFGSAFDLFSLIKLWKGSQLSASDQLAIRNTRAFLPKWPPQRVETSAASSPASEPLTTLRTAFPSDPKLVARLTSRDGE